MLKIDKALLTTEEINGYSDAAATRKKAFHAKGKTFLKQLASEIGLPAGSFDIRSNIAGVAVSGEVTLHAETIYIQIAESFGFQGLRILFRTCKSRKDYGGGQNNFFKLSDLIDEQQYEHFIRRCKGLIAEGGSK